MSYNPPIKIYVNKIEIRVTFKIKTGHYLELLTPETMKLLGNTRSKITQNKNSGNMPHLEITEIVLVHSKIVTIYHQQDSRVSYTFVPNQPLGQLLDISIKFYIFESL